MKNHLLLVDYENVPKADLSGLDDSYRAIIFVGASQDPPKAARKQSTAHRFRRVEFQKIGGSGKNALNFHIACHLGRMIETAVETICIVVSNDKGFDPLLQHLNDSGLCCRRVASFDALLSEVRLAAEEFSSSVSAASVVCRKCGKSQTIELHGGRWCTNCGRFASTPDPNRLPSSQMGYREPIHEAPRNQLICGWCDQPDDMLDGIYDDGEWMCGGCISHYAR